MALLRKSPPTNPVIPPLTDHPEHQRLTALRVRLVNAKTERQNEIDMDRLEAELRRKSIGPNADRWRARVAELRKALPTPPAEPPNPEGLPPSVVAALKLLAGGTAEIPQERGDRLIQLRKEVAALDAAVYVVVELLTELKKEQSVHAATALMPRHRAALAEICRAAEAVAAAVEEERQIIVTLLAAGYDVPEHILLRPAFPSVLRMGSLDSYDSELATFRRYLQTLGVI